MGVINLISIFTREELNAMKKISDESPSEKVGSRIQKEVIKPVIERVNKSCGQEMDPMYLAYMCIYLRPWPDSKR